MMKNTSHTLIPESGGMRQTRNPGRKFEENILKKKKGIR
jgi:hypothetical protein